MITQKRTDIISNDISVILCSDDVVFIVRSQHDSYHKSKANIFKKKLKEQVNARSIKVYVHQILLNAQHSLILTSVGRSVDQSVDSSVRFSML